MPDNWRWRAFNDKDPRDVQVTSIRQNAPAFAFGIIPFTVPGDQLWHLLAVRFTHTTNATVANRTPKLTFQLGGTNLYNVAIGVQQAASLAWQYTFMAGIGAVVNSGAVDNTVTAGLPDLVLLPGYQLNIQAGNSQTGDTVTNLEIFYEMAFTTPGTPPAQQPSIADQLAEMEHAAEMARWG